MTELKVFSQNAEQPVLLEILKHIPNGKFIDVGAYAVERFSNTRALYLIGWKGVFVEPQPENYKAIADHYAQDQKIKVLNVAIGDPAGSIEFYESNGDAVGTTNREHMEKWAAAGVKYSKITVQQVGVKDFMEEYARDVDFISVDTESTNIDIFRAIPDWVWNQIHCLCIEHDGNQEEIETTLNAYGFETRYVNAENIILSKP